MKLAETSYAKGVNAEDLAANHLEQHGYEILNRRYKTKFGEIDLIAKKNKTLCFVEVKIRQNEAEALESVTLRSQKRIESAALYFLSQFPEYMQFDMRFDVIAITKPFKILHLDNAWQARS